MSRAIKTEKPVAVSDVEISNNYMAVGIRELGGARREVVFEESDRSTIDRPKLGRILGSYTIVGFNWNSFDKPLLAWFLQNPKATVFEAKQIANRIIGERMKWWECERKLDIEYPRAWDHIDLFDPNPNPIIGLKALGGRMHVRKLQELPYEHDAVLTPEQRDRTNEYMSNDLDITEALWNALAEAMALREAVGETIGQDVRSKSDTQLGLAIIKHRVEQTTGKKIRKVEASRSHAFQYTPPDYLRFERPVLRDMMERIRAHTFRTDPKTGKADLPDFLLRPVTIGRTTYTMGIGGLHSTEANRVVRADHAAALLSVDVASYYPAIILSLGLFPAAVGPDFLKVYDGIRQDRLAAKRRKDKAADKSLKIALNGCFGSLGSPYSFVYAPHLLLAVTLTGQLALLMLIERAEQQGATVVSANTDGVEMLVPREQYAGITGDRPNPSPWADLIEGWERDTQFDLEAVEYRALCNQSVNSYFAIKTNGGHKRKGPVSNPWSTDPSDADPRAALMKNPQTTICSDAALARIKDGTPVAETIRGCRDVRQFVSLIKVTKGATWRGGYLGKVVRFYYAKDGDPILEAEPHPTTGSFKTVAKTDGCRPLMTFEPADGDLPWVLPDDIDYARYEAETEKILSELGYYGAPAAPVKFGKLTAIKLERLLPWAIAA